MIPLLGSETMTRSRYAAATWVDGLPIRPTPTTLAFYASRVPLSRRKQQLPDGIRANETVYLISYTELLTASDGVYADRVTIGSVVYEVIESEERPAFLNQPKHWQVLAVRVQAEIGPQGTPPPPP